MHLLPLRQLARHDLLPLCQLPCQELRALCQLVVFLLHYHLRIMHPQTHWGRFQPGLNAVALWVATELLMMQCKIQRHWWILQLVWIVLFINLVHNCILRSYDEDAILCGSSQCVRRCGHRQDVHECECPGPRAARVVIQHQWEMKEKSRDAPSGLPVYDGVFGEVCKVGCLGL